MSRAQFVESAELYQACYWDIFPMFPYSVHHTPDSILLDPDTEAISRVRYMYLVHESEAA